MMLQKNTSNKLIHLGVVAFSGLLLLVLALLMLGSQTLVNAHPIDPPEGYPKLSLSMKTVTPTLVNPGNITLTYWVEIKNTGAYTAEDAMMIDMLPAGATYNNDATSSVSATIGITGGNLSWQGDVGFDTTVVVSYSVSLSMTNSGEVTNTAVISHPMISQPVTVTAETIVTNDPIFEIEKTSWPEKPGANKPLYYTIKITNIGQPAVALPITVTDVVPTDTMSPTAGLDGSTDGNIVTWTRVVSLELGESTIFTFNVMVDDVVSGTVIANNTYGVTSTPTGLIAGDVYTVTIIDPIFTLFKELLPDPPGANNDATYQISLYNDGSLATDLVITDTIPQYAIYEGGGTFNPDMVLWTLDELDTGESAQFTFTVSFSDIAQVNILNNDYAACSAEGICISGDVLTNVVHAANFETYVTLDPYVKKPGGGGGPVTPTLVVKNIGPGNAIDAVARIQFERISVGTTDMTYIPNIGSLSASEKCGDKCVYFLWTGDLAVGEAITFTTIEGQSTIGGSEGTHYTATVVVTDTLSTIMSGTWTQYTTDPVTGTAIGKITHLAHLVSYKNAPKLIGRGQVMTYSLRVHNTALSVDNGVPFPYLWDYIPTGTEVISISHGGQIGTYPIGSGSLMVEVISWTLPALSTGEDIFRSFVVRVDNDLISGTKIINNHEVYWYEDDATYQGLTMTVGIPVTTTVQEIGLIDSYKTVTPTIMRPGDDNMVTYELHIVNSSGVNLSGVQVDDYLPWASTTYQRDAEATGGQVMSDIVSIHWNGSVAGYFEQVVTFTAKVDPGYEGAITNTMVIAHPDLLTDVVKHAVAYVTNEPVLKISKTATPDPVQKGNDLMYTIKVVNLGQQATNLVITDVIPADTTYVPDSASAGGQLVGGDTIRWQLPVLDPGDSRIYSFRVTVDGGSQIVNEFYGVSSAEGVVALGEPVTTNVTGGQPIGGIYLPVIMKSFNSQ